ncbi:MAG: methyl-accepting chemotaxis protein [Lautropia sp.]|nr:methyl-accepting chemotaxis protein [Lautropia sp.]
MSALSSVQGSADSGLPGIVGGSPVARQTASAPARSSSATTLSRSRVRPTPLLGRLSLKLQSIILLGMLTITVAVALALSTYERQVDRTLALQNEVVGDTLLHSQRLAKAASLAVDGNETAFGQLQSSQSYLNDAVSALQNGGEVGRLSIRPLDGKLVDNLAQFRDFWEEVSPSVNAVIEQQTVLTHFASLVDEVVRLERILSRTQEGILNSLRDSPQNMQELLLMTRLNSQVRTIVGEILRMRDSSEFNSRDAVVLANAIEGFARWRSAAMHGDAGRGAGPLRSAEARDTLRRNDAVAEQFVRLARQAQQALPALEHARAAGMAVFNKSDELTTLATEIRTSIVDRRGLQSSVQWMILGFASAAVLSLLLLCKAYYDDSKLQADRSIDKRLEAERMEQEASRINDQNQAAILRLMNELQDVADGDLTVQATVSDDITGAIADSINYTVEELRSLVGRINRTAEAVAEASDSAQVTASHLQAVSEQQSREIRETGEAVLNMAAQIKQVSASASESAEVARQSLSAASRGRDAVQNAIAGMGGIREQIQDTAKRIKRLGESSQEIGEIVELISNITEQTNVLALNAAIQAASAGEAGRGFTVVAEEVQRLAERSAEATRQISALVKAIQTDTHDAVAAMERSTQGVVRGAKLSDEAGMALIGIGQVSQELADLIMRISKTTENQAASASSVAQSIQRILLVNSQTNEGTQQTAGSILQLSELARELKNSVARFRVN